jgi:hypothetical protein
MLTIQVISKGCGDKIIDRLVTIERALFLKPFFSREEYVDILESSENINILLISGEELICGYASARPHNIVAKEIRTCHPDFLDSEDRYYADTIEIIPEYRKKGGLKLLLATLILEAFNRFGIKKWSTHARISNGFSKVVLRMFPGIEMTKVIQNFMEKGEDYLYVQGVISDETLEIMMDIISKS